MKNHAKIHALEFYLPKKKITNTQLAKEFSLDPDTIFNNTGIRVRYTSNKHEISSDLAVKAGQKLFSKQPALRSRIDYLIFCTQTFDYSSPTSACIIQNKLGLRKDIGAIDIGLGCSGFVYSLSLAKGLIETGQAKNVLILTSETLTKYLDPKDKNTRLLFGDGASAVHVKGTSKESIGKFSFGTDGSLSDIMFLKSGGFRLKAQVLKKDDTYDYNYFYMDGIQVFTFSLREVPGLVKNILKANKKKSNFDDIDWIILHQASKIVLNSVSRKLNIPPQKFLVCMENCGNTVSSTIPITLKYYLDKSIIKKGDKVLLAGFGVGVSWAGTIITI